MKQHPLLLLAGLLLVGACGSDSEQAPDEPTLQRPSIGVDRLLPVDDAIRELRPAPNPDRNAYFGDLHVHTAYSQDAYAFGATATPYDAYRFALGEAIRHPTGYSMRLKRPLDFYGVTDHGEFLGLVKAAADTSTAFSRYPIAEPIHDLNAPDNMGVMSLVTRLRTFGTFPADMAAGLQDGSIDPDLVRDIGRAAWLDIVQAAEQFNRPGRFTTFVAYEYTTFSEGGGNLHRNVVFRGADRLPAQPFSAVNSTSPEDLWDWMDGLRSQGIETLAIPHNSNASNGQMFKLEDWAGNPIDDAYAARRLRNEPLAEITQVKGTSETHPLLSTTDEWADFEIMPYLLATLQPSAPTGGYVRDAYLRGLSQQEKGLTNPYKFGLIGSSDTHVAASSLDEETYWAKVGIADAEPYQRGSVPTPPITAAAFRFLAPDQLGEVEGETYILGAGFSTWGASGLAAVWAEENTRSAIYDAFRRKETFATSGPRIKVRFFAGYGLDDGMAEASDRVRQAYAQGVTMGSDLLARAPSACPSTERRPQQRNSLPVAGPSPLVPCEGDAPQFLVWAMRDALGAPLQRAQIIKGYVRDEDGKHHEAVYDVACSDGLAPDPGTRRCPDNGARVNLADCGISADKGAEELIALWRDPDFETGRDAFYYVRVLENPTCRWSTWDAMRAGIPPRPDLAATIQERAWSSPIWLVHGPSSDSQPKTQ